MAELARRAVNAAALVAAFVCLPLPSALAQAPAPAAEMAQMPIGHVALSEDPRYDNVLANYQVPPTKWTPTTLQGAQLGIVDAAQIGMAIDTEFTLRDATAATVDELAATVTGWVGEGVHFVLADLPADQLLALSDALAGQPVTLFNTSAQSDALRGELCRANVVHTIPSWQMATDAIVQYLVFKNWRNILVLQGPEPADQEIVAAVTQSARFFGATITEVRPFVLTADPRQRDENNAALVTEGTNYDVVFIADSVGEFARNIPYRTNPPRPVVGTAGLTAEAWHWSFERQGAPQVNSRFQQANQNTRMHSYDWAAWAAVRAVTQSVLRAKSTDYEPVRDYLLGERMNLDGSKGNPMSVRPWDHQLRQGMLLSAGNSVVELAPLPGFLHETNDLDTLGVDQPRTTCRFQ